MPGLQFLYTAAHHVLLRATCSVLQGPSRIATLRARLAVRDPDTNPVDKMPWVAISPCPPLARKLPVLVRNALKTVWVCCGIPSPKQVYWLDDRRRLLVEIKSSEIVARAGRRRRRSLLDPLNP